MKNARLFMILLAVFLTACGAQSKEDFSSQTANANRAAATAAPNDASQKGRLAGGNTGGGGGGGREQSPIAQQVSLGQADQSQNPPVVERKIIRNADLTLEADAPEEAMTKITAIAESKGGFVVESQQSTSDAKATKRDVVTMTARVPAAKFNEALDEIRKTASRVLVETVKGEDVTEEFIDIEARLKAKLALEAQFLEIMKQAKSVEDALNVQTQLSEVRGEIERIEGRKRFLENQTSLSTLKIRLQTPTAFSTNSRGFFYQFGEAVGSGVDAALAFVLGLVTFLIAILPFLIFIVLPIYLAVRYLWKRRQKEKSASEIIREEIKNE
jgi:Na+-transporting methylmalonyl-CoA/oxaloacetate decarboxylase gamma subunit